MGTFKLMLWKRGPYFIKYVSVNLLLISTIKGVKKEGGCFFERGGARRRGRIGLDDCQAVAVSKGGMAERFKAAVLKTAFPKIRERRFKSCSLR